MDAAQIRDIIVESLELELDDVFIQALGNRVHVISDDSELEIVIRTMTPKGSARQRKLG